MGGVFDRDGLDFPVTRLTFGVLTIFVELTHRLLLPTGTARAMLCIVTATDVCEQLIHLVLPQLLKHYTIIISRTIAE